MRWISNRVAGIVPRSQVQRAGRKPRDVMNIMNFDLAKSRESVNFLNFTLPNRLTLA
jgi:hypothetical protein